MAVQSSSTPESTPPVRPADQTVPARERALKQWRGDAVKELRREADRETHQPDETSPAPEGQSEQGAKPRRSLLRRHPVGAAVGLVVLLAAAAGGYVYYDAASHFESTDDAFIAARQFSIAPKVSGYITAVPVTDNQHVKAGDVIARIDDRDYKTALAQAEAQVRSAAAGIDNIDAQLEVQQAQITASQAQVEQAQAALTFAQQQADRYQQLARSGSGTVQSEQQYTSQLQQAKAGLTSAQANLRVAQRQLESLKAQRESAQASLAQAQAQRDQAQLNLSYTTVTAAQPGRVVNLSAADGQFVAQGTALSMFVPDEVWVTADFKETQLDQMRPGQPVTLEIDAYPEREIRGHVASVQSGSGPAFSLLPPQNATGNYVKIVQRVPVKIEMDDPPTDVALGPGMSVVPTVRVDPKPSLYERLKAVL
ncbi:HlyD family secretion protein [Bradyrhizobium aeschynomenes]|uniref:HlyD family secretion protein n=1 Tax=Bradyrhizobium aeschynomenes TaxID=2734909 RepID=UPI001556C56F|nr:HlyD family secretion protein [Bradyrhizobium aeschynomenes]NPV23038.1 HlyD family secretion protein [Bradyrhizobium aeschynomenes]